MKPAYMSEDWYGVLASEVARTSKAKAATQLGVSRGMVSQVINGIGLYGSGRASTQRFAERVIATFATRIECPYLSAYHGEPTSIDGAQCRAYAYREAPTANPGDARHWRACRGCAQRVSPPSKWHEPAGGASAQPALTPGVAAPDFPPHEAKDMA